MAERTRTAAAWRDWVEMILTRQCRDGSANDGGFAQSTDWYCGRHAAYTLARLMAARLWAGEINMPVALLDSACTRTLAFIRRRQASDGRLDLLGSYSSNEIGFPVTGLALAWKRYEAAGIEPSPGYMEALWDFCRRGGEAILAGSALTANHRWAAVCAPLAVLHRIKPDGRYLAKIESLLAQGLDVNLDGCWEYERSPNYNSVASQGVLVIIEQLGRDDLVPAIVRHGHFVLHSLQPNGEMDSTLSHRQDRAQFDTLAASYGLARRLAQLTGDGRFTALAEAAWHRQPSPEGELVPLLLQLDAHPDPLPAALPLPDHYEVFFERTLQARIRTPRTAVGLSADSGGHFFDTVRDRWGGARRSEDWFHLHHAGVVIESLVLAGAGMQNLQPGKLRQVAAGCYELEANQSGWEHTLHFQPGSPLLPVRWDWKSHLRVEIASQTIALALESISPYSLAASLVWRIRPGVTLHEAGRAPRLLAAGDSIGLAGGAPLRLEAADGSTVVIEGTPVAAHAMPVIHAPAIPSSSPLTCATLSLGLCFPVSLNLRFTLSA